MRRRLAIPLAASLLLPLPAAGQDPSAPAAEDFDVTGLIRRVVRAQRQAEEALASYTFDQREVRTDWRKDGTPADVKWRLFYWTSGEKAGEGTRELVLVDGRQATEEEKRKSAEEDEKDRKKRLERRAADRATDPPKVAGSDDDPTVGTAKLSDLISRFHYRFVGEDLLDGRPSYVLDFWPRAGLKAATLADQALNALAGRVVVDAVDFQVRRVDAKIVKPVKVGGGIAAKVNDALLVYEGRPQVAGRWFPCVVDVRLKGKKALVLRLDVGFRAELFNFQAFDVEAEAETGPAPPP